MVKVLLDKGADFEAKNKSGWTPLIFGTSKLFIQSKFSIEIFVHIASSNGYIEVVKELVKGADIEAKSDCGSTSLINGI